MQATDGGGTAGKAEHNDRVTFTYASVVNPALVLSGWDGSATTVRVVITDFGANDVLSVENGAGTSFLFPLGLVQLKGDYVTASTTFTGSTMTATPTTITLDLGTPAVGGIVHTETTATTMVWSTFQGTATESGVADVDF